MSEAERAREEGNRTADDGSSGLQGGSGRDAGKAERALKQMMGGTLASKEVHILHKSALRDVLIGCSPQKGSIWQISLLSPPFIRLVMYDGWVEFQCN